MAKSKQEKRESALARLTASIADDMANGRNITFSKRQEYNTLKRSLGLDGYI